MPAAAPIQTMIRLSDIQPPMRGRDHDDTPCIACGKATDGSRTVHLTTDGFLVRADATVDPDRDQGWFDIGPECARKLPSGFVVRA